MLKNKISRLYIPFLLFSLALGLSACPHLAYYAMKSDMEKAQTLNERKPSYSEHITDAVSISDLENASLNEANTPSDSTLTADSTEKIIRTPNDFAQLDQSDPLAMEKAVSKDKKMQSIFDNDFSLPEVHEQKPVKEQAALTQIDTTSNTKQEHEAILSDNQQMPQHNKLSHRAPKSSAAWEMKIKSTDESQYPDQINMRVQILDTAGRSITGLAPPHFKGEGSWKRYWQLLTDSCNGVHEITDFTVKEITQKNDVKNALAFVLDHSGSMGQGKIYLLNRALAKILTALNRQDYVSVIKFAGTSYVQIPLSNDKRNYVTTFQKQIDEEVNIEGGTRMYDALHVGIKELKKSPRDFRRSLILLSDGADFSSKSILDSAVKACKENNISIISVDFDYDNELMREVAYYTGGTYYKIYTIKEFPFVFRDLYYSLNNFYEISYTPPECAGMHKINLRAGVPGSAYMFAIDSAYYDKSIITKFDAAGTTAMLNIEFETGSAELSSNSKKYILQIFDIMRNNPDIEISIKGHTDDVGSEKDNYKLSLDRAKAVKRALVQLGIKEYRLETKGMGESSPLVPNDSDENRKLNRRTEFVVIDNE